MKQSEIQQYVTSLENVETDENMGYLFYYVGDDHHVPFVSIAENGNEYETMSKLDREGVFRVNIGVSRDTFVSLFPNPDIENTDFSVLNTFLPHPHYSKQYFICILNPSEKNGELLKKYILEAYDIAKKRLEVRNRNRK